MPRGSGETPPSVRVAQSLERLRIAGGDRKTFNLSPVALAGIKALQRASPYIETETDAVELALRYAAQHPVYVARGARKLKEG